MFPTTLIKTCWDKIWKSSKSRNDSIFKIPSSPPYPHPPPYQCWIWPSFVSKSQKLCKQHWLGGTGAFSLKNRFSILSQRFCPRSARYWHFLRKTLQTADWYRNACWCTAYFKFNQFQVINVILMNYCS